MARMTREQRLAARITKQEAERNATRPTREQRRAARVARKASASRPLQKNNFDQPRTAVSHPHFDVPQLLGYFNSLSAEGLDGIYRLLKERMVALGVKEDPSSLADVKPVLGSGGNMGSVVAGLRGSTDANAKDLQQLMAAVKARFALAGYEPKEE